MSRIQLRVANKRAYVWDVDDVATLRAKHHICGILTGTLPQLAQQNVFLGVPLLLMPEEVVLLLDNQIATLVDDPNAYNHPLPDQLTNWHSKEKEFITLQITSAASKENSAADRSMSEDAIRKRKERQARKMAEQAQAKQLGLLEPEPQASSSLDQPKPDAPSTAIYNVVIASDSSQLKWYSPAPHSYDTIDAAKNAGIWDFPSTAQDRAKCGIYRDLWEQGYFMGTGIKFGGDYLVYPGDPLRYHSHFSATILESPTSALQPMEIVAHGRLGTATKKTHLLCGWDEDKKTASYLSIEWAGFG